MNAAEQSRPVIVAGAGPVGMTAALALHARGVPVKVLEAEARDRDRAGSRAIYIHGSTLRTLERIHPGLGMRIAEAGLVWPTRRTLWRGREVFSRTYPDAGGSGGLPHFTSLPQVRTEAFMLEAMEASGLTVHWQTGVEDVQVSQEGVALTTTGGDTHETAYLIAADGAGSAVRGRTGIPFAGSQSGNFFLVADAEEVTDNPHPCERVFHYNHPGAGDRHVLLVPFKGGWRIDIQGRETDDPEAFTREEYVADLVGRTLGERYSDRINWVSTYRFKQVVAESFADAHRRVLLAGEAAHLFAPFGARGMNSGIADADAAASAVTVASQARFPAVARGEIERFASQRRKAALWNAEAARLALVYLQARHSPAVVKQLAAALVSRWWEPAGKWLDEAPYGPRAGPPLSTDARY